MLRVRQIKVRVEEKNKLKNKVANKLKININEIEELKILKESIDARKKPEIYYVYEVAIKLKNENKIINNKDVETYIETKYELIANKTLKNPVIVGSGPAGLFAAYMLALNNCNPIIIERGEKIEDRVKSVEEFWKNGKLNLNSNVQFGEGGAGTFSDGKLNTLVKDKENRCKKVFEIFIENGAPEDILYVNKPHIGTDLLRNVIINMRNKIISMGGVFKYNTTLTDLIINNNNKIDGIILNNNEKIYTDTLILAIGHSARDTFEMLYKNKINITSKPFAIGVRIMHPQDMIDKSQYGDNKLLPPASYKLTHKCKNGRGVYSFCMCPGGFVVNASSEENMLVINGMSNRLRDEKCANSAIIVTISDKDFGNTPLSGIDFQRKLEQKAYEEGNGNIPIQLYKDFKQNVVTKNIGNINPVIKGSYKLSNLNDIFPKEIVESLIEGIDEFNNKIKGFNREDAVLAAIESRTSSPIRIIRDDNFETNIKGIYPIGEGSGYAGGITTSAIDGLKVVEKLLK